MTRLHKDIHRLKAKLQSLNVVPPPKTSNQSFWSSTPSLNPPRPSNPVAGRNIDRINAKLQLLAARPQPKVSSGRISDSQESADSSRQSGPSPRKPHSYRWAGIALLIALALFASVVIKPEIIGLMTFEETNRISLDRSYENNSLEILQFKGDPLSVRVSGTLQGKSARVLLKSADQQHVVLEVNQEGYFEGICQETCDLTQMHGEIVLAIEVQDANLTLSELTYVTQSEDREPVWTAKKTRFILRPDTALTLNLSNYVKDPEGETLTFLVAQEGPFSAEIAGEMLTLQASQTTLEDIALTLIASDSRQVLRIPLAIAVESGASVFDNTPALVDKKLAEQLDFIGEAKAIIKFSDDYLEASANRSGQDTE